MKKRISILLCLALAVSLLAACGSNPQEPTVQTAESAAEVSEAEATTPAEPEPVAEPEEPVEEEASSAEEGSSMEPEETVDAELEAAKEQTKNESEEEISLLQPIKIRDLTFSYGTRANVLEHVSMEIQPGDRIAVIGQSGSGKTTLAKLLLRFYEVKPGAIRIGNQNLNEISHAVLRSKMAYISQNNFLFSGTIHDNLTLGRNDIPMREVAEACKQSRADEFIMQLPGGYDTRLEENGSNLSGGQRQRLAIARALLRKPEVLIMDEATSNLDSETEKDIQTTIDELAGKITIIIIAHRLGTIRNCDEIYVMNHGHIIESGTHQSLMKEGTEYYNMWKSQMPNIRKGETL